MDSAIDPEFDFTQNVMRTSPHKGSPTERKVSDQISIISSIKSINSSLQDEITSVQKARSQSSPKINDLSRRSSSKIVLPELAEHYRVTQSIKTILSINEEEDEYDEMSTTQSTFTFNAEPIYSSKAASLISGMLLGSTATKMIRARRRSNTTPSVVPSVAASSGTQQSANPQIWYGSQRRKSLRRGGGGRRRVSTFTEKEDTVMLLLQMEQTDAALPIRKSELSSVIWLMFALSLLLMMWCFLLFLWCFTNLNNSQNQNTNKYLKDNPYGGLIHYLCLLVMYGVCNVVTNKITLRIDARRQYIFDVSVQLFIEIFIDSLYWLLFRYSLLGIIPLMDKGYLHQNSVTVIAVHLLFMLLSPGLLFSSELMYNLMITESLPYLLERTFVVLGVCDDDMMISSSISTSFIGFRDRYSLVMVNAVICSVFSGLAVGGVIVGIYFFGDNVKSDDSMYNINEGVVYVLLSVVLEFVCLLIINCCIFEGAMMEPFLRIYELNPLRMWLSIGIILGCALNVFGLVLFQQTLAGIHTH